jgi:hypothetical protein
MVSFNIAINTYFQKKRSRASGIVATATGLGPVIIPLVNKIKYAQNIKYKPHINIIV